MRGHSEAWHWLIMKLDICVTGTRPSYNRLILEKREQSMEKRTVHGKKEQSMENKEQ